MQKYVIALYIRLSIEDYKYDSLSSENQSLVLLEDAASICFFSVRNTVCSSSAAFRRILWQRLSLAASEWRQ